MISNWKEYKSKMNNTEEVIRKEENKYLNLLVGHWIVRKEPLDVGITGFQDTPVFLLKATDDYLIVAHYARFDKLKSQNSIFEMKEEEVKKYINKERLTPMILKNWWVDEHWIKHNSLFLKETEPFKEIKKEEKRKMIGQLILIENNLNVFYLYNVTEHHILVVDFGIQENNEYKKDYKYLENKEIEEYIQNGKLTLDILPNCYFDKNFVLYNTMLNLDSIELKNESAQFLSALEGKFVIRTKRTKEGYVGYQDKPLYIHKVSDYHIMVYDSEVYDNSNFSYNGESPKQIDLAIRTGILNPEILLHVWMDKNWIEFH